MRKTITYYQNSNNYEYIYNQNSAQSYPLHTHANHVTIGYILDGVVRIICAGDNHVYRTGEYYWIKHDTPHAIESVNNTRYSMISLCISVDEVLSESENAITDLKRLKQFILDAPENTFMLEEMSHRVGISPYHMIRKFKAVCGLTPHQFQIQCRVRKAQKLLLKGQSVTEVAYATGFCDQSHFDRCFQKIVRMTPSAYKQSVKRLS
jgi:AraC-like DNA-binding protein